MKRQNNRPIIFILILVLTTTFIMTFNVGCTPKKPSIFVDGKTYKFNTVQEGTNVVFTFFFFNSGTNNLVVDELHVSCSCIKVKEYTTIVKPGGRGKVYGVMETKGFQGPVVKKIQLKTNIKGSEPVVFTIEGTITPGS